MSPTPVTYAVPTAPAVYTWEATNDAVAEKYGVAVDQIVRFDLNTSPAPPEFVAGLLARNRFEVSLSEYPPSDYRRLVIAASQTYGVEREEIVVGAGADEILDMLAKAFLAPGSSAIIATPTYSMYRVVSEQRGATVIPVPRLGPEAGWAIDRPSMVVAARHANLVWLCNPNNPTGTAEPPGEVAALLDELRADAEATDRIAPVVAVDEAYVEFSGDSVVGLRRAYPGLVVVRTASKAYALAGLRVGFALGNRSLIERIIPFRPPNSVGTISVTAVTEALRDRKFLEANIRRVEAERARVTGAMTDLGWRPGSSVTNFILVDFGSPARAERVGDGLLRRGIVPRTFGAGHPLNGSLRFTVRNPDENDRLLQAAAEIEAAIDAGDAA